MNTTNRGSSRQSEYERSIAGAGNVRHGDEERYGGGSSGAGTGAQTGRYTQGTGGESGRFPGEEILSRGASRLEEGMERVSDRVSDTYDQVSDRVGETYDDLRHQGRQALRTTSQRVRSGARVAQDYFEANPLMIGAVGLGLGLILGALFPISRRERQILEPIGDNIRESAVRQGAEVVRQARKGAEGLT
jgi:ElaB/YqjD/DUF883 family membrane-anchored ribosome-binding protein